MTNLDSILKSGGITLATEFSLVKAMIFPGFMYGCESWTIKKAEHRRIDAFELWCWRGLLRVPWATRRLQVHPQGDQIWVFMLKQKLQFFGHLMRQINSVEKTLMLGKQEEMGKIEDEMFGGHHRLDGHEFEQSPGVVDAQGRMRAAVHGVAKSQT